jgi:hypothetical protein
MRRPEEPVRQDVRRGFDGPISGYFDDNAGCSGQQIVQDRGMMQEHLFKRQGQQDLLRVKAERGQIVRREKRNVRGRAGLQLLRIVRRANADRRSVCFGCFFLLGGFASDSQSGIGPAHRTQQFFAMRNGIDVELLHQLDYLVVDADVLGHRARQRGRPLHLCIYRDRLRLEPPPLDCRAQ